MLPLTSILKNVNYSIELKQEDLESGKLVCKSRIRIDKITPIKKELVKMKIGVINQNILEVIKGELNYMF